MIEIEIIDSWGWVLGSILSFPVSFSPSGWTGDK